MINKLLEVDPKKFSYKEIDKDVLRFKAINFKRICMNYFNENIHVRNEFSSRKELIEKCERREIGSFINSLGQTYEEYERLLPMEVSQAWASFNLYLINCVSEKFDNLIVIDNRYYVSIDIMFR